MNPKTLVLGIESSCDETGVALYDSAGDGGLLAHALLNFSHLCLFTYPWPLPA